MAQLTVVISLVSTLSVAGLGVGLNLIQDTSFNSNAFFSHSFGIALAALFFAVLSGVFIAVSRYFSFKLTARKIRHDSRTNYNKRLTICGIGSDGFDQITNVLLAICLLCFAFGSILFVLSIAMGVYSPSIDKSVP